MHAPLFTYRIDDLPGLAGAKPQAVGSSDRGYCAAVAALASLRRGNLLRGQALGMSKEAQTRAVLDYGLQQGVNEIITLQFADAINGAVLAKCDVTAFTLPDGTHIQLDEYQTAAVKHLTVSGGILGLDMGLGKTATAVAAAIMAARKDFCGHRCWIVCPLNAMGAWEPYLPILRENFTDVKVLSVDSAHKYSMAAADGGCLIFDEAHLLGAGSARRTANCHTLRRAFDFCLCLTGTLLHAGLEKVLSIMDLAIPGSSCFASRWACGAHWNCLVKKQIGQRTVTALEKPGEDKHSRIAAWLRPYATMMDTDDEDVAAAICVPPQSTERVDLGVPWNSLEDEAVAIIEAYLARKEDPPHMAEVIHVMARSGWLQKQGWLYGLITEKPGEPVVVFAHYTETMDNLAEFFTKEGITFRRIDGTTPQKDRPGIEAAFRAGEFQVLLGQMRAAGISLNLQRACVSVAVDFSWSPIDYAQAKRRTRRRGQTRDCTHYDLVANRLQHTILERIKAGCHFNASVAAYRTVQAVYAARVPASPAGQSLPTPAHSEQSP